MSHSYDEERIRAELEVSPDSSWHHGLEVSLFQVTKAAAVGFVHCSQDLNHALFVLKAQWGTSLLLENLLMNNVLFIGGIKTPWNKHRIIHVAWWSHSQACCMLITDTDRLLNPRRQHTQTHTGSIGNLGNEGILNFTRTKDKWFSNLYPHLDGGDLMWHWHWNKLVTPHTESRHTHSVSIKK